MAKVIATIRLNSGQGSFFDELTRIHLTVGSPQAEIVSGMNLTNIRKAVKSSRLTIVSGKLEEPQKPFRLVRKSDGLHIIANGAVSEKVIAEPLQPAVETTPVFETVQEEEVQAPDNTVQNAEPITEEVAEQEPAEEKPKKKGGRKKKAATEEK